MERRLIRIEDFNTNIFNIMSNDWMLLTAGNFENGQYNTMTVSWGMMGTFWSKPMVMVGIRPQRHTFQFAEDYESFTLSAFPEAYREKLAFCGANSGRDVDKIKKCKLTPTRSEYVEAPSFAEATLVIECRKVYTHQLAAKNLIEKMVTKKFYADNDFHKMYWAEVKAISATDAYRLDKP